MAHLLRLPIAGLAGLRLGNLPSAGIAARMAGGGHGLVTEGTGNPGAMNSSHVLGKRWGAAVSAADIANGAVAAAGRRIVGSEGASVAVTAAVVGHCHPLGHSGDKGVATSIGHVRWERTS